MMPATLTALIAVPAAGGLLAALVGRRSADLARWTALATAVVVALLAAGLWWSAPSMISTASAPFLEQDVDWIPRYGVRYHLAADGLSLPFVLLTGLLGVVAVLVSWREIERSVGTHYLAILATLAGIFGVFLARDLFLFYFFWELMLVPMYFLIGMWGHERRIHAALKFMLFTLISGLLLLVAILGLYWAHGAAGGELTTAYADLLDTPLDPTTGWWLFLGFVAAFAVKLPAFPVHTWLPEAHTEAPTAGSILLAGLLLKTGGYGLIRFAVPLFPEAAAALAGPLAVLGVAGILYGAVLALGQEDMKRMIAYASVSHMGFVLLAVAVWSVEALQGAVMQMVAHGVASAALFAVAGFVQERLHTREFRRLGGLWSAAPRLAGFALLFAMANLGLPGTGNFIGEFAILLGSWPRQPGLVVVALVGVVIGTVVSLALMRRGFLGAASGPGSRIADLDRRETAVLAVLALAVLALGMLPGPVLDAPAAILEALTHEAASGTMIAGGAP